MKRSLIIAVVVLFAYTAGAQEVNEYIRSGNDAYRQQQYDQAELAYRKAIELDPKNTTAQFNLANTLFRRGQLADAARQYDQLSTSANSSELRGKAYYNKGVLLTGQKKLEESVDAYKNALRQNPDDKQARENLEKALQELKKKQPQQKKNDQPKPQQNKQQQKQQQMSQKEAEQRLKLLEQKEKEVQQRLQKAQSKSGGGQSKDW